nr:ribonuclease H-like domain-containing protein [Tanacetum cinerariifolium]
GIFMRVLHSQRRDAGNTGYKARDNDQTEDYALMETLRGLPSKIFGNGHTCVACQKGKQHKASCKAKTELEKLKRQENEANDAVESLRKEATYDIQNANTSSTNLLNTVSTPLSTAGPSRAFNDGELLYLDDPLMPRFKDIYTSQVKGFLLIHLMMMNVWSSDVEDSPVNDRFEKVKGMHAVPPHMTRNYMPPKFDFGIDESKFTYGLKQSTTSESDAKTNDLDSCDSNSSIETLEFVPKLVATEPKAVSEPKVWSDAPIIEEYESDSNDEHVPISSKEQEKPTFGFVNTIEHVKTPRQTIKKQNISSQNPKPNKRDLNGLISKRIGLGYGFTKKACFVCGSFSHIIRDCDFHEKRMAKQIELNKQKVLTKTGRFPVNAARQNFTSQAVSTRTARKVNIARPKVNEIRPRHNMYKSHSPIRRPFNKTTTPKANFAQHKVNTDNPHQTLKGKGIVDSGCSRHMTGNKAYLVDYQDFNGCPVAFGGSKGQITGKGKIRTRKLDFKDVYFVKELQHFNLFSVSQMCDKKNKVLFTDTECLVLSLDFKLPDENQILLRVPRQHNMYSFNFENIVPSGGLACLIAKATVDESTKWHRRLGHVNFKNLNKLVKENLVRGKFEENSDEGFLVGYSLSSKAFRPITAENKAIKTAGPKETNNSAGTQDNLDAGNSKIEADHAQEYYVLLLWSSYTSTVKSSKAKNGDEKLNQDINSKTNEEPVDQEDQAFLEELERLKRQEK